MLVVTDLDVLAAKCGMTDPRQGADDLRAILSVIGEVADVDGSRTTSVDREIDRWIAGKGRPSAIQIIGSTDVVKMYHPLNPVWEADPLAVPQRGVEDINVATDDWYGDTDGDRQVEIPVARLPLPDEPTDALALLNKRLADPSGDAIPDGSDSLIYHINEPRRAKFVQEVASALGTPDSHIYSCLPRKLGGIDATAPPDTSAVGFVYLNLHGNWKNCSSWSGEDPDPKAVERYVDAYGIQQAQAADMLLTGACYGAVVGPDTVTVKRPDGSETDELVPSRGVSNCIPLALLADGADTVIASTRISYSGVARDLIRKMIDDPGADRLRAFHTAKNELKASGDTVEQKMGIQYVYYGLVPASYWASPPVATTVSATSLVFDVSGSMADLSGYRTKIEAAKDAGLTVLDIMNNNTASGSTVGVGTFSDSSTSVLELTDDQAAQRTAVSGLTTWNMTNMLAGIQVGVDQLAAAPRGSDRAIIYLSDGQDTMGNSREGILAAAEAAGADGIRIYTIGFGDQGAIDEPLLEEIADVSGGKYGYASVDVVMELVAQLTKAQVVRSGANILAEQLGSVSEGQTVDAGVAVVPPEHGDLEVILAWPGSDMDVVLTDPSGATVAEGYPGYSVTKTERTAQVKVEGAKPGDWGFDVVGVETSVDDEPFYLLAAHRETTGTPAPTAGGGTTNDGSGLLLALVALLGVGVVAWVFVSARTRSAGDGENVQSAGAEPEPQQPMGATASARGPSGYAVVDADGVTHPLAMGATALGRASDNDIVLSDATVSRHHAMIVVGADGMRAKDLGSTQGTMLDGAKVDGSARAHAGSVITIGAVQLTVTRE